MSLNRESVLIRGETIKEGKGADFGRESRLTEIRRRMSGNCRVQILFGPPSFFGKEH